MRSFAVSALLALVLGTPASAATIPESCQSAKQKLVGSLAKCLHFAEAKFVLTGENAARSEAIAKCTTKFSDKWAAAEQKAIDKGGACQTIGDLNPFLDGVSDPDSCINTALATGETGCLSCGDGVSDLNENCELGTLYGGTCSSATTGSQPFGTLGCSTNCTYNTSECADCTGIGGQTIGGSCWLLGTAGASCDATCSDVDATYDAATKDYAGSDGTDGNCIAVLAAIATSATFGGTATTPDAIGCFVDTSGTVGTRDLNLTQSSTGNAGALRACACQP